MKDSHFFEQNDSNAATFALADLGAEISEQRFEILSLDIRAGWMSEDKFERALVLPLHPYDGTIFKYHMAFGD